MKIFCFLYFLRIYFNNPKMTNIQDSIDESKLVNYPNVEKLKPDDIKNLCEAFTAIDADGSQKLDKEELQVFMNECNPEPEFTDLIMKIVDKSRDGQVDITEFLNFIQLLKAVEKDPNCLFKMLFEAIDEDHNGSLDEDEIGNFVNYFSPKKVEKDEIKSFMNEFSSDKNKTTISFDDLLKILQ